MTPSTTKNVSGDQHKGPLHGLRIVEFAGIGPAPMTAMLLADLGADVIRIDRLQPSGLGIAKPKQFDFLARGRQAVAIDLKHPDGVACALDLVSAADGLIEGFRPGVMERLGLGPDVCLAANPRLVYGRVTGWGQGGPLASAAGHDLNYIALSGALHAIGRAGAPPTPPLNLVGDFGGGGLYLAFGMVCALLASQRSGVGQVVDAAMIDGAATLMTSIYGMIGAGLHGGERGTNILDSGAPYYDVYRCADGGYVSVAPIEDKFIAELLRRLDLDAATFPDMADPANWPAARAILTETFARKSRAEWCALLEGTDVCFAPVLSAAEAPHHPHVAARGTFVTIDGAIQPAPGPRFSRTPPPLPRSARQSQGDTAELLQRWAVAPERIATLRASGVVR
ncbi:CoA transferase [Bradyrhizobium sp. U87765 SZCCT0131]|uniref:CaiB/BaiF CoA transferase family protein n=1 Tax=unclassified Bradyrhizobium TaxID=2631580 RepID=UPI001BA58C88|nr:MULTISPECIES: CaiB/BaiF CoA-transferase family protein [unclassified Bradyrhizobium]MBR1221676.1 CoA transferase [Bradyrhizobium sp. U87765 SZCCT0131]MBR1264401.1 CoA transferase [Bradyrhizobium sp. U87765 SZCCT0134]MBR1304692.1 CoA transferase [Bradyrhizobium sp. U87765 SZCCT0110]MBR1322451.1 CoA transferase [Bradyrhizobium sp. U87765 SZCCT0109]MBR1346621.1 CoA transferase [Bradyrhizobium sp. U87765 SZCCT0048]